MADGFSVRILSDDALKAVRRVEKEVQKANVAAVRAAGKALQEEARRRAPVYAGTRKDVPKGRLRKGIRAGRVVATVTQATVKVGPRGPVVHKYAAAEEARSPYMGPAYAESATGLARLAAEAYAAAIAKGAK